MVAIKKLLEPVSSWNVLKFGCWLCREDCLKLQELNTLAKLQKHPNIVRLQEVFKEDSFVHFVFHYEDCNLLEYLLEYKESLLNMKETKIQSISFQLLEASTC